MLNLLGWDVSMSEKKRFSFQQSFVSLGVQIRFGTGADRTISVSNKPGRIESLERSTDNVQDDGRLGFREALSLSIKGEVAYAEGQLFGRVAAPLCRFLSPWSSKGVDRQSFPICCSSLGALEEQDQEWLGAAKPRPGWLCLLMVRVNLKEFLLEALYFVPAKYSKHSGRC